MQLTFNDHNLIFCWQIAEAWDTFNECDEPKDVLFHPRKHLLHPLSSSIKVKASALVNVLIILKRQCASVAGQLLIPVMCFLHKEFLLLMLMVLCNYNSMVDA